MSKLRQSIISRSKIEAKGKSHAPVKSAKERWALLRRAVMGQAAFKFALSNKESSPLSSSPRSRLGGAAGVLSVVAEDEEEDLDTMSDELVSHGSFLRHGGTSDHGIASRSSAARPPPRKNKLLAAMLSPPANKLVAAMLVQSEKVSEKDLVAHGDSFCSSGDVSLSKSKREVDMHEPERSPDSQVGSPFLSTDGCEL